MTLDTKTRNEIVKHNIRKAHQAIEDSRILLERESFTGALNRIYYSGFYIISALAIRFGFSTSKHSQLIGWFNKNFVKTSKVKKEIGRIIYKSFEQRMESDYNPLSKFTCEEIEEDLEKMREVITSIEKLVKG